MPKIKFYKPIKLTNANGIKEVKKNLRSIFKRMPIYDVAYLLALNDIAGDLGMVVSELDRKLNDSVVIL